MNEQRSLSLLSSTELFLNNSISPPFFIDFTLAALQKKGKKRNLALVYWVLFVPEFHSSWLEA